MAKESELSRNMYGNTTVRLTEAVVEMNEYLDLVITKAAYINSSAAQANTTIHKWAEMDDTVARMWPADRFAFMESLQQLRDKLDNINVVLGDSVDLLGDVVATIE